MIPKALFETIFSERVGYWIFTILKLGFLVSSIYLLYWIIEFQWKFIYFPYQHEYREAASVSLLYLLREGQPIFSFSNAPVYNYAYGFVYPLLGYLIDFGQPLFALRWVTTIFSLLSAFWVSYLGFRITKDKLISIAMIPLLFYSLLLYGNGAFPNTTGQFFFLLSLTIPLISTSARSLGMSIAFGLLAFYTKSYFILGPFLASFYMFFFMSKRMGLYYGLGFLAVFLVTIPIVDSLFPTYFSNNIFGHAGTQHVSSFKHMFWQLEIIYQEATFLVYITILIFSYSLILPRNSNIRGIKELEKNSSSERSYLFFNLKSFKEPLIKVVSRHEIVGILCFILLCVFIFWIGKHPGNSRGAYFYHIGFHILMILIFFTLTEKFFLKTVVLALLVLQTFTWAQNIPRYQGLDYFEAEAKSMEQFILSYENVLNTGDVAYLILKNGRTLYNNGNSNFFIRGKVKSNPKRKIVSITNQNFLDSLYQSVKAHEFDLLMINNVWSSDYFLLPKKFLRENYELMKIDTVHNPWNYISTEFWVPKKSLNSR